MRLKPPRKGLVGVDITSAAIKLIELKRADAHFQIERHAMQPLREGAVVERRIRDMGEVATVLQRVVEDADLRSRRAVVAVPSSAAITKTLTLPASLNDDEIEARIIQFESDRHIPFPFSEVAFDFQPLGLNARDKGQQDVLLVACRQQDVSQLASTLDKAGLVPAAVDVETFANERAFGELRHQLPSATANDCVALVDIGASMSAFHVLQGGRTIYSRDTTFGGRQLTEEICRRYSLTQEEADLAKKRGDLPAGYQDSTLAPFLDTLVQQIGRSLQLYYTTGLQPELKCMVLAGGSSMIPGFAERLSQACAMQVVVANPFLRMHTDSRIDMSALISDAPAMVTACGLAMRASA